METLTMGQALEVTLVSLSVVFLVLILLMLILQSFTFIFKKDIAEQARTDNEKLTMQKEKVILPVGKALGGDEQEDEETKTVAILIALIMANHEAQDKKYQIESVKLID